MNTEQLENSSPPSILPVDTGAGAGAIAGLVVGYVLSLRIRRKIQKNASDFFNFAPPENENAPPLPPLPGRPTYLPANSWQIQGRPS